MLVQEMLDKYFDGDRNAASANAGVSIYQFNNWISQGREVRLLDDGDFVLMSDKVKIIVNPQK